MPGAELLPGVLDLLVLRAVSLGAQHGYGILLRIQQITGQERKIEQGALYPALYRLETRRALKTEWGVSVGFGTSETRKVDKVINLSYSGRVHDFPNCRVRPPRHRRTC
jgi:PadR family transcriptional regulator, regulatory protein PadR